MYLSKFTLKRKNNVYFFWGNLDFRIPRGVDTRGVPLSLFDFMQTATKKFNLTMNLSVKNVSCLK